MMRVLVTGATGFLGSHVVRRLHDSGHEVRILARTPAKVAPLMAKMGLDDVAVAAIDAGVVEGDVTDRASVHRAVEGCDAVVHAAAMVAIDRHQEAQMTEVNVTGTVNAVDAALAAGCDPVLVVSSVAALLPFRTDPVTAEHPVQGADNPYGRTKAAAERHCRSLQATGAPVVTVYPSGIVGPDDWTESIQIRSWKAWLSRFPVASYRGSWIDVRDVAAVIEASLGAGGGPQRLLAMGTYLTAEEHHRVVCAVTGRDVPTVTIPRPLWWVWGKAGDVAARFGTDLIITSDAYDYLFGAVPGDDAATEAATGVRSRSIEETFADTVVWLAEAGHVDRAAAGVLLG